MAKPKFYLEPRSNKKKNQANEPQSTQIEKQAINMFYSIGAGKRLQYYTGIRIEIKYFRAECNKSDKIKPIKSIAPYAEQDNNKLIDIAKHAVTIASEAKGENRTVKYIREQLDLVFKPKPEPKPEIKHNLLTFFEKIIEDSESGKRLIAKGKSKGSRYSRNSIKNYGIALSALQRYMKYSKFSTLNFEDINKDFYEDFRFFCYDIEKKEKSTFGGYIKDIKTVMSESKTPGFDTKEFVMPSYEADTIYLTNTQVDKIAGLDLSDRSVFHDAVFGKEAVKINNEVLDKVRDLFLIGCYTGLRFSDFNTLQLDSIADNFINIKQTKTEGRVTMPIMSKLRPVLKKYPRSLPSMADQKFNYCIKLIAKLAGLTELKSIKNTKGNTTNIEIKPLFELISSHCCRRTYATNMFKAGIPPMLIMSATGHKTETSFLKYIRATNDDKAKLLSEALQKLGL